MVEVVRGRWLIGALVMGCAVVACAQQDAGAAAGAQAQPQGQVLFQSHGMPPAADSDRVPMAAPVETISGPPVTDQERAALTITSYDLDAHVTPASSALAMHAEVSIRNDGARALDRITLAVSSTLHWDSATLLTADGPRTLVVEQHRVDTDADHIGSENEAVIALPRPLLVGATAKLEVFYAGTLRQSAERLLRIGAGVEQANAADWDGVTADGVMLRGFGDVLWYPVSEPPMFLGDGARLFDAIGKLKRQDEATTAKLRLAVDYVGVAPVAAFFCGQRKAVTAVSDARAADGSAVASGVATADFPVKAVGFRTLDLFTIAEPEAKIAPLPGPVGMVGESSSDAKAGPAMLSVETNDPAVLPDLATAAEQVAPMFEDWLGPRPLGALTVIDHPGQPFEDGALVVAPARSLAASDARQALAHSLAHAWVQTGQPWIDEGLAQFFALQWIERTQGRDAAVAALDDLIAPLALGEPEFASATEAEAAGPQGQPLIAASDEMFYRRKAAAVWWMLRDIVGDTVFRQVLSGRRMKPVEGESAEAQAVGVEKAFEAGCHCDLGWFFDDWVLHDKGLPDLSIVNVVPRSLSTGPHNDSGWLVAVTVHNDGAAAADVPLVVRSGAFSVTRRIRIDGFSSKTERVVLQAEPTEVVVNDGVTPEVKNSVHTRTVNIQTE